LKGDSHKRRRHLLKPEPPRAKPECPDYLGPIAHEEWEFITAQLEQMKLLSRADKTALEFYCSSYERYRLAEEKVRTSEHGEIVIRSNG
jgi:P27 family predicted phage terminase small subunit